MAMEILTRTLHDSRAMLETVLVDSVQVLDVGSPVTTGVNVTRSLTEAGEPIAGLVQSISLENAIEGKVTQLYSVKVASGTALAPGQAVKVLSCLAEPDLVGQVILLDNVSRNGLSMIRKATGQLSNVVNQEGKEALA